MRAVLLSAVVLLLLSLANPNEASKATDFTSGNLVVVKDEFVSLGAPSTFTCTLPDESQQLVACDFERPNGRRALQAAQGPGRPAGAGRVMARQEDRTCELVIAAVTAEDLGDWSCVLQRSGGASASVRGRVNLRTEGRVPNVRLPGNTVPSHYDVDLITVLEPEFVVDGAFSIQSTVTLDTIHDGFFSLHFRFMTFVEETVMLSHLGSPLAILEHIYDFEREIYTVQYVRPAVDAAFALTVSGRYLGIITEDIGSDGLYKDFYTDRATGETRYLAATQFETSEARQAFPCLDEPALKATFKVRIGRKQDLMSLTNAPLLNSDQTVPGYTGYVWDEFDTTVIMSTYLNAFFVGDFDSVVSDPTPNSVLFNTWARPDAIADGLAEYSKRIGPLIQQHFGDIFNIPFPLPKQDQIAFPNKGGAMENWGLVTYGETALIIDPSQSSDSEKYSITSVNAHELAHQWFGDLVTTKWWDDIWLNEGFATYWSYFGVEHVEPDMQDRHRFYVQEMRSILRTDALPSSVPMLVEVNHASDANFGSITYDRGATMLWMIEHFITLPTLISGVTQYLNELSYNYATTDDLWFYLNRAAHADGTLGPQYDMRTVMDPWLKQKNYPLLTVTRNYATGSVSLQQQRFLTETDTSGDTHNYQWYIPLTYTLVGDGQTDFNNSVSQFFLEPAAVLNFGIGVTDSPIIFNIQNVGYYRVNYDAENWDRISQVLNSANYANIHDINRAQILYDTYALALAGIESYDLPLSIFTYLERETDYVPLSTAIHIFTRLNGDSGLPSAGLLLRDNLLALLSARFDEVGLDENVTASFYDNVYQRELATAVCNLNLPACVDESAAAFAGWMEAANPDDPANNPVNRQVKSIVYCTAVRNGQQAQVDFLQARLAQTFNPQARSAIAAGIRCASDEDTLRRELDKALASNRPGAVVDALKQIAENPAGRNLVWQWLTQNCQSITNMLPKAVKALTEVSKEKIEVKYDVLEIEKFLMSCPLDGHTNQALKEFNKSM